MGCDLGSRAAAAMSSLSAVLSIFVLAANLLYCSVLLFHLIAKEKVDRWYNMMMSAEATT